MSAAILERRVARLEARTGTPDAGRQGHAFVWLINASGGAEWLGDPPPPEGRGPHDQVFEVAFIAAEDGRPKEGPRR